MVHSKKNNPYFKKRFLGSRELSMPEESKGLCKKCKQLKVLGDGYCIHCWDKQTGAARTYVELE